MLVRASTFFDEFVNRPPETPRLLGAATRFVIHVHRRASCVVRRAVWGRPPVVSAEPLEDVGDVRCLEGLGDVVRVGDVFAGVPKLCCGAFGVCFFLDEGGHGLAEGVGGDPGEVGVCAGLAPLPANVVG